MFYSSYIQTYINQDVSDMITGVDKLLFTDFIRAAAYMPNASLTEL